MSLDMWATYPSATSQSYTNMAVGMSFIPAVDITVVALRRRVSANIEYPVYLSDNLGNLLASVTILSPTLTWAQTNLTQGVNLKAGTRYTIWGASANSTNYFRQTVSGPTYNTNITSVSSRKNTGTAMPTSGDSYTWYFGMMFDITVSGKKRKFAQII